MLSEQVQKLKQILKSHRRSRKFETEFATQMISLSTRTQSPITEKFRTLFPKLCYLSQENAHDYSYCSINNQPTGTINLTSKSEGEGEQQNQQLNNQDEILWRKYYKSTTMLPTTDENQEILRIVECLREISQDPVQGFFDTLYKAYQAKGGVKSYQEFKEKLQSDVIYLVNKEKMKKK